MGSGDSGVQKCTIVAKLIHKFVPRSGSGDSGVQKCIIVTNFVHKFQPRLGSGDSGVQKCIIVAAFVQKLAPRLGSGDLGVRKCRTIANLLRARCRGNAKTLCFIAFCEVGCGSGCAGLANSCPSRPRGVGGLLVSKYLIYITNIIYKLKYLVIYLNI